MLGAKAAQSGFGGFLKVFLALFYANDAIISHRDLVWLQESLDVLIELFKRIGFFPNRSKTKAMICVPGKIQTRLSTSVYNMTGVILNTAQDSSRRVDFNKYDQSLTEDSLASHIETQHGIYQSQVINQELLDRPAEVYVAHACTTVRLKFF